MSIDSETCRDYCPRSSERTKDLERNLEAAIYHLLCVWEQYGTSKTWENNSPKNGRVGLIHANMRAGENASEFLKRMGYGQEEGYFFIVNQRGCDLMNREDVE